ncbi:MAG TPA: hypothetical protein VN726_11055 [Hanamia sp.]|nr:hypothetical protein [Hanamia sp.]
MENAAAKHGPWEQVASVLAEALVKEGIEVTLFATGDSITGATLELLLITLSVNIPLMQKLLNACT